MPQNNYNNWLRTMKGFLDHLDNDVNEIRRYKDEIQKIKEEMTDRYNEGQYIRDEHRIVISAPEIIIGNVLKDGTLIPNETSKVVIRANNIQQEGVGTALGQGTITNKATEIKNVCLDPGVDGNEEVVSDRSRYTVQAQSVAMLSEQTEGTFAEIASAVPGEIKLQADSHISVAAMAPLESRRNQIEHNIEVKNADKQRLQAESKNRIASIEERISQLNTLFALANNLVAPDPTRVRTSIQDLETMNKLIDKECNALCNDIKAFQEAASKLAEANRQIKTLNAKKTAIENTEQSVKNKQTTGASIDILAENTKISSMDANYKMCESEGAGLEIGAKKVEICAAANGNGILKNSEFSVNTHKIALSTANSKPGENQGEIDMPAEGQVNITSRKITMETVDKISRPSEKPGGVNVVTEKALTNGGVIKMRAKYVNVKSQTTDGLAEGEFTVNSKIVKMSATNKTEDGKLDFAPKSYIELAYNQTRIRAKEHIIMDSDKSILVHANENVEIQQSFNKAAIQLCQGNASLKGDNTKILGKTTLTGTTTFNTNVEMNSATVKDLKVTDAINTPNSSEGTLSPVAITSEEAINLLLKLSELEQKTNELLKKSEEQQEQETTEEE